MTVNRAGRMGEWAGGRLWRVAHPAGTHPNVGGGWPILPALAMLWAPNCLSQFGNEQFILLI